MYSLTETGIEKKIESWEIIIPLHDNQDTPFPERTIKKIKDKILNNFGGLSSIHCMGSWKGGDKIYNDENLILIVDIPVSNN